MAEEDLVEEYLDAITAENEIIAATEVMDTLGERLKETDGAGDKMREMLAAGNAISQLAEQADDPTKVVSAARDASGDVAQVASIGKDRISEAIGDAVGDLEEQAIEEAGGYRVDHGIGLDRFLEDHLEEVVVQRSTDAVDDPVLRWRFDEGERVETKDGVHFDHYHFFKKLSAATDRRLVTELASEKAEDHSDSAEEYARKSLGPKDRPWSRKNDLWTRSISGLVEERSRTETVLGPRTEAWEHIRARIASGRGVRDLDDAVTQGMIYVAEDVDEIWIPTSMVADAVESVETSRRALQSELAERGIDSDELSGSGISEAVTSSGTTARFWRLDATHDEVPEPETVLDEADDPTERSTGVEGDDQDDSGPSNGPETFGRAPEDEDDGVDEDDEGGEDE
ncbi:hypothetical protein [Halogeometricum borinquense]|uniref:hypothetical protein n=1 Tax=Halogeometricum borinquense TaxID=60847 RepID=UPI0034123E24